MVQQCRSHLPEPEYTEYGNCLCPGNFDQSECLELNHHPASANQSKPVHSGLTVRKVVDQNNIILGDGLHLGPHLSPCMQHNVSCQELIVSMDNAPHGLKIP